MQDPRGRVTMYESQLSWFVRWDIKKQKRSSQTKRDEHLNAGVTFPLSSAPLNLYHDDMKCNQVSCRVAAIEFIQL